MANAKLYQIRCEHCDTSFAPETRRCVHCGAALGGGVMSALAKAGEEFALDDAAAGSTDAGADVEETDGGEEKPRRTSWPWIITAVAAMFFSLLRQCQ